MKTLLKILAILLYCLTPAAAQFGEADAATIVVEQLESSEEPGQALLHIINLDLSQASPERRTELGLLALDHAITMHRFDLLPKYFAMVDQSMEALAPSPRAMARFLLLTLEQRAGSYLEPEKARRGLLSNLNRALELLKSYRISQEDGETWVCSRLFLGRAFGYWVRELVEHQILLDRDVAEPIKRVRDRAESIALDWATTEETVATLAMSHGYLNELVAVQGSLDSEDPLYPLLGQYQHLNDIRAVAKEKNADKLVEESLGRIVARRNLFRVARIAEQALGRPYTREEADQVKAALAEAVEKSKYQGSIKLAAELFVTGFEASFSSNKPDWLDAARQGFSTPPNFLKNFPELSTRYFTARARLNLLDGHTRQAAEDTEFAVKIYQSLFKESGLSEEGLYNFRRRAGLAHELLIEARLLEGDVPGAFAAAADYQALESLSVLTPAEKSRVFDRVSARQVSQSLKPDEAVLVFFPGRFKLYSFLVTNQGVKSDQQEVTSGELQDSVFKTMAQIRRLGNADEGRRQLYQTLLGRWDLSPFRELEIAPSSFLSNLSWGLLLNPDGKNLCQSHTLSIQLALGAQNPATQTPNGLRALGNPDGSLPAAEVEVEQIASQFAEAKVATGQEATRLFVEAFSEDVMHFATHGTVNFRKPHTSYLLLANGEHLAAQEIARDAWDKAALVVLSACNTGTSSLDFVGHRSLAGAFLKSGSPAVLATLWPVDDEATRVFMNHFYTALSLGDSPKESVQKAQLKLLESPQFQHPYYWAGFVLFEG